MIRSAAIAVLAVTPFLPVLAHADDSDQTDANGQVTASQSVTERSRPEYDPIGQRLGAFMLYPQADVTETYDDNINATSTNEHSDLVSSINPSVQLKSNWGEHALNFHASADAVEYARYTSNDYTDYSIGTDGRLDIYHDARMYGSVGYSILHLPWWSPNTFVGQGKPTEYSDTSASLAAEKEFNHLSFRLEDDYDLYNFSNVTVNGATAFESKNDYGDNRLNLKTDYELVPGRDVYVLTGYDWRMYDDTADLFGFNRNSTGYTAAVGTKYDVTGVTFIDAFVGYQEQDYADARLGTISGATGGAKLTWNVTTLDTITGNITRSIDETVISGASGYFATVESIREDHELLRNLLLNASFSHESDDFQGISMDDDYYILHAGATYLLNENFRVTGGYQYQSRTSNLDGAGAGDNQVFLGISARL